MISHVLYSLRHYSTADMIPQQVRLKIYRGNYRVAHTMMICLILTRLLVCNTIIVANNKRNCKYKDNTNRCNAIVIVDQILCPKSYSSQFASDLEQLEIVQHCAIYCVTIKSKILFYRCS